MWSNRVVTTGFTYNTSTDAFVIANVGTYMIAILRDVTIQVQIFDSDVKLDWF